MSKPVANSTGNGKRWVLVLAMALILSGAACGGGSLSSQINNSENQYATQYANEVVKETAHPNGLLLRLPESISVKETGDGFYVEPPPARVSNVQVSLHKESQQPDGVWSSERRIGNRLLRFRVDGNGEATGSGGAEYQLSAWETYASGYVLYKQMVQTKSARPDFGFVWYVVACTSVRNSPSVEKN